MITPGDLSDLQIYLDRPFVVVFVSLDVRGNPKGILEVLECFHKCWVLLNVAKGSLGDKEIGYFD